MELPGLLGAVKQESFAFTRGRFKTREAVLSSRIEGTRATTGDIKHRNPPTAAVKIIRAAYFNLLIVGPLANRLEQPLHLAKEAAGIHPIHHPMVDAKREANDIAGDKIARLIDFDDLLQGA